MWHAGARDCCKPQAGGHVIDNQTATSRTGSQSPDIAAVWALRLHREPGGPTTINRTARFVIAIFDIVITFL
jgi:hypothetical protein